jgi:hypothetical protein
MYIHTYKRKKRRRRGRLVSQLRLLKEILLKIIEFYRSRSGGL